MSVFWNETKGKFVVNAIAFVPQQGLSHHWVFSFYVNIIENILLKLCIFVRHYISTDVCQKCASLVFFFSLLLCVNFFPKNTQPWRIVLIRGRSLSGVCSTQGCAAGRLLSFCLFIWPRTCTYYISRHTEIYRLGWAQVSIHRTKNIILHTFIFERVQDLSLSCIVHILLFNVHFF